MLLGIVRRPVAHSSRVPLAWCLLAMLLTPPTLPAQASRTYTPTVSSVSPRDPQPGGTVTVSGTDLAPPTWTVTVSWREKYTNTNRTTTARVVSGALEFNAPSDLRPDSIFLQYAPSSQTSTVQYPVSSRVAWLPSIHVRRPPVIERSIGDSAQGPGGSFRVIRPGTLRISGRYLLNTPTFSSTSISAPQLDAGTTFSGPSTSSSPVRLGPTSLPVVSRTYYAGARDVVEVTVPSALAHNTTAWLRLATNNGADSVRVTLAQPPLDPRLYQVSGTPVTDGIIERGRTYVVRGRNLSVTELTATGARNTSAPSVRVGSYPIAPPALMVVPTLADTMLTFTIPTGGQGAISGTLSVAHPGGSAGAGSFSIITRQSLQLSGLVASAPEVIGGSALTLTASLSPAISDFSTAGSLLVTVPATLAGAIPAPPSIPITANPMTFTIPTSVVGAPVSGMVSVSHGGTANTGMTVPVTVRPPYPTALTLADTIPGGARPAGSIAFDVAGTVQVQLSSSDPTMLSLPSSVTRTGATAGFQATTQPVTTPRTITVTASVAGRSAQRAVTLLPAWLVSATPSTTTARAGDTITVQLNFNTDPLSATTALSSSDAEVVASAMYAGPTATSKVHKVMVSDRLAQKRAVTLTGMGGGRSIAVQLQVRPVEISAFTVTPTQGAGGTNAVATITLERPFPDTRIVSLVSSDTTVARFPQAGAVNFFAGETTKVVPVTLVAGQATTRSATLTARLHVSATRNDPVASTRLATVSVTP